MRRRAVAAWSVGTSLIASMACADSARSTEIVVSINKAAQTMSVLVDGYEQYAWAVSTGLGGGPPVGTFPPGRMERKWASRKYNMAPMPHSIFFEGNYAVHGTIHVKRLGQRASKGCVRLHPIHAATLFELVQTHGKDKVSIVISNTSHVAARADSEPVFSDRPKIPPEIANKVASADPDVPMVASATPQPVSAEAAVPARVKKVGTRTARPSERPAAPEYGFVRDQE